MAAVKGRGRAVLVGLTLVVVPVVVLGFGAGWSVAGGYVGGLVVGAGMLGALVLCVHRLVAPPAALRGPRWPYLLLHLGKFAAAAVVAWLLVVVLGASIAAFAAGYLVALVAFLAGPARTGAMMMGHTR